MAHEEAKRCKIADKLEEIHDWAHTCLDELTQEDLQAAHFLGHRLLDFLNGVPVINAVKFIAIFEVLSVGADHLEHDMKGLAEGNTATIN